MSKRYLTIFLIITTMALCRTGVLYPDEAAPDPSVRVLIVDDANYITLYIKDPYTIDAADSGKKLLSGPCIETKIVAVKEGLYMRDKQFGVPGVSIKSGDGSKIFVNKKPFRGAIDVLKKPNGKLMVINIIGIEEYLYGVLYNEVSHRWPMEALKAQAIAARTFALYQASQSRSQQYDLRNDIYSQVYSGSDFERWSTKTAVDVTRGKVLVYDNALLPAYYHATCSGGTEDSSVLWKVDIPPLDGVVCDFCRDSKYYRWVKDIPLGSLEKKLKDAGYDIGKIVSVRILSKNKSGRVERLAISDVSGRSMEMAGKDFRQIIGPNELRSVKFDVEVIWGQLLIEGRGWGHGVGMCQWGVYGQARQGKKAEEMLKYYYPGSEIVRIDALKARP